MRYILFIFLMMFSFVPPALADCTSPAGAESATRYDFTAHKLFYCNNTAWVEVGGASGGGISTLTIATGTGRYGNAAATCPAGYFRTGCSSSGTSATPSGSDGCGCTGTGTVNCYAYCAQ